VHAPTEDKSDDTEGNLTGKKSAVRSISEVLHGIFLGVFNAKVGQKIFSNQQSGIRVDMKLMMVMRLQ
jgi:hypothetical protein